MANGIISRSPSFFASLANIRATLVKNRADLDVLRNSAGAEATTAVAAASGAALDFATHLSVEALDAAGALL